MRRSQKRGGRNPTERDQGNGNDRRRDCWRNSEVTDLTNAAGGFVVAGDRLVRAPGLAVDVVDTTGAGDSFDAGFLCAWLHGEDLATAVRWGTVAGSLSTRGSGGTAGQPTRAEVTAALAAASGPAHAR